MSLVRAPSRRSRPSAGERERVARRLRDACADERVSVDTLSHRLDLVYSARSQAELEWLVADLPEPGGVMRTLATAVGAISRWSRQLEAAWREPRTARLTLPTQETLVVGRSRRSGCIVSHETVSRIHASIAFADGGWSLRDLGSTNGTFVNGRRIIEATRVHAGDEVQFGAVRFVLVQSVL